MDSGIRIVHPLPPEWIERLLRLAGDESPLHSVMRHVAERQLARAYVCVSDEQGTYNGDRALISVAEKELVRPYVGAEFCGLCGRYTCHQGEH